MEIVAVAHNIRSIHNVGSIFRTCDGFGVARLYLSGYTPSPDFGLPHVRAKLQKAIHKTALGAEEIVPFEYAPDVAKLIKKLRSQGFRIVGLEQDARAIPLNEYKLRSCNDCKNCKNDCKNGAYRIALILGEEVHGLTPELRDVCDDLVEIPMFGQKESFNVAVATGIILYHLIATQSSP
jgi:tRNA G18 (ribose-2'-O)-methylase SpoU